MPNKMNDKSFEDQKYASKAHSLKSAILLQFRDSNIPNLLRWLFDVRNMNDCCPVNHDTIEPLFAAFGWRIPGD
nr:hypothetical protein [uncultured Cohaesibacter sp.]